jgi:hypothetical protein
MRRPLVALGFGGVSAMGLHHGWEIARSIAPAVEIATVPDWLMTSFFVFLAMGEPASFRIVEAVRNGRDLGRDHGTPIRRLPYRPAACDRRT